MASSFTRKRNLEKPGNNDADWGTATNANFDTVEEEVAWTSSRFRDRLQGNASFAAVERWEQFDIRSGVGGSNQDSITGVVFDGRYIYYAPFDADSFCRYDTTERFQDITAWQQLAASSGAGGAPGVSFMGDCIFDGRYIHFQPSDANTHIRYDTTGTFTDITSWEQLAIGSALGATTTLDRAYNGLTFDGRYVYFVANDADTFVRYDTALTFLDEDSWEQVAMSSAQGGATLNSGYIGATSDGRYVYFTPRNSDTLIRFDSTANFTDITSWEQIALSSGLGAAAIDTFGAGGIFDGKHVYYVPLNSDTMVRFDTTGTFTDITDWEQVAMSSAIGATAVDSAFSRGTFDGRYVYYAAESSDTHTRFDVTGAFTDITSWEQIEVGSTLGQASASNLNQAAFDGRYIYYGPSVSNTFIRFRASVTANPGPTEYSQVAT